MSNNIENEVKFFIASETQAKFFPNISEEELDGFLGRLKALFHFAGFDVTDEKVISNKDRYFDTKESDLDKSQHSLRIRENEKGLKYTIKKPLGGGISLQRRHEIENAIENAAESERLINSNFSDVVDEHLPEFSGKPIVESAVVNNTRRQFTVARREETYKVSIDLVSFSIPESKVVSKKEIEIEIETKSEDADSNVDVLKQSIRRIFPELSYSHNSKYSRAISFIEPFRESFVHKLMKLYKDHIVISVVVIIIGLIGSLFSIYGVFSG